MRRIEDLNICEVWAALGGGPLRGNRGRAFWRNGDGYNVSLYPRTATWRDHRANVGGGIRHLVEAALGCDRRAALAWLGENFQIETTTHSPEERRAWAKRMQTAKTAAAALVERRDAYLADLQTAGGILLDEYHRIERAAMENEDMDLAARAEAIFAKLDEITARRDRLRTATGGELVEFFAKFGAEVAA